MIKKTRKEIGNGLIALVAATILFGGLLVGPAVADSGSTTTDTETDTTPPPPPPPPPKE